MADALFSACFLNSCLRNSKYVEMANMAPVVNTRGPLFVHPLGIVKRTTYHVMKLYTTKLQPNVLPVSITSDELSKDGKSVPVVDAVVTCSNDKKQLAIALVNKDPEKEILCNLGMGNLNESITATILSGDSTESFNDIENPDRVVPQKIKVKIKNGKLMVPAHSLVILEINR